MRLQTVLIAASLTVTGTVAPSGVALHDEVSGDRSAPQTPSSPVPGLWTGEIGANRMAFEVSNTESGPGAVLYVLANEARAFRASSVKADGGGVTADFSDLGATLQATATEDGLDVKWTQVGREVAATFQPSGPLDVISLRKAAIASGVSPTAPLATEQFAFLVGEWHGTTKMRGDDGEYFETGIIVWKGEWLLGGTAVQNTSQSRDLQGRIVQHGLDTRIFSPKAGHWQHQYADAFTGEFLAFTWTMEDGDLVSSPAEWMGPDGEIALHIIRIRVEAPDRFIWTADMSKDGGETWTDSFLRQDNVRVR